MKKYLLPTLIVICLSVYASQDGSKTTQQETKQSSNQAESKHAAEKTTELTPKPVYIKTDESFLGILKNIPLDQIDKKYDFGILLYIAYEGFEQCLDYLLANGYKNLNFQAKDGNTALMAAVGKNHQSIVQKLLAAGASPNLEDSISGVTVLRRAIYNQNLAMVRLLLEHNADILTPKFSAVAAATNIYNKEKDQNKDSLKTKIALKILHTIEAAEKDAHNNAPSTNQAGTTFIEIKNVIQSLRNPDLVVYKNGNTWLHFLASQSSSWTLKETLDLAKELIAKKANVNATNLEGYTPLIYAVQEQKLDLVRYLLTQGAQLSPKIKKGEHKGKDAIKIAQDLAITHNKTTKEIYSVLLKQQAVFQKINNVLCKQSTTPTTKSEETKSEQKQQAEAQASDTKKATSSSTPKITTESQQVPVTISLTQTLPHTTPILAHSNVTTTEATSSSTTSDEKKAQTEAFDRDADLQEIAQEQLTTLKIMHKKALSLWAQTKNTIFPRKLRAWRDRCVEECNQRIKRIRAELNKVKAWLKENPKATK